MRKIGRLEYEVSKTVLYVRTVETSDTRRGDDEWMLPDHIEAESEIRKLIEYAHNKGYHTLEVYLDNGYKGSGIIMPADLLLHRRIEEGDIKRVIMSSVRQIPHAVTVLAMELEFYESHDVQLWIAEEDCTALEVYVRHHEEWLWERLDHGIAQADAGLEMSLRQLRWRLKKSQARHKQLTEYDFKLAKDSSPKATIEGLPMIDGNQALWLLKPYYERQHHG